MRTRCLVGGAAHRRISCWTPMSLYKLPGMRRKSMLRTFMIAAAAALTLSAAAFAGEGGTAEEARAMLDKAVAAVKADKTKALDMFNKGEGGFRDRDLYVFCNKTTDGTIVALGNPNAK